MTTKAEDQQIREAMDYMSLVVSFARESKHLGISLDPERRRIEMYANVAKNLLAELVGDMEVS